jgi:uncharacterized protein
MLEQPHLDLAHECAQARRIRAARHRAPHVAARCLRRIGAVGTQRRIERAQQEIAWAPAQASLGVFEQKVEIGGERIRLAVFELQNAVRRHVHAAHTGEPADWCSDKEPGSGCALWARMQSRRRHRRHDQRLGRNHAKGLTAPIRHGPRRIRARQQSLEQGCARARDRPARGNAKIDDGQRHSRCEDAYLTDMRFTQDPASARNVVRAYAAGEIKISDAVFRSPVIVSATAIAPGPVIGLHELAAPHAVSLLALEPEIVLLGTGARQIFPAAAFSAEFLRAGIGFEAMDTGAACRTFNVLVGEQRRVAALLFP